MFKEVMRDLIKINGELGPLKFAVSWLEMLRVNSVHCQFHLPVKI